MRILVKILAITGLLITFLPSVLNFLDIISTTATETYMLIGTLIWFVFAYFWLGRSKEEGSS